MGLQVQMLNNPLINPCVLSRQVRAFNFNGFLHWGFNQWSGDSSMAPINESTSDGFIDPHAWNMSTSASLAWLQGDGKLLYCGAAGQFLHALHSLSIIDMVGMRIRVVCAAFRQIMQSIKGMVAPCIPIVCTTFRPSITSIKDMAVHNNTPVVT